jgi:MFS superfamily sulfate permease-like transporter
MAKKNFSGTGLGSIAEEKPAHKRTLLDEINVGKPSTNFENKKTDIEESTLKRHTFLISDSILEKIKDYVYTVKIGGNLMFTQQECLETAISEYLEDKKITPRPDEYREKFKKR